MKKPIAAIFLGFVFSVTHFVASVTAETPDYVESNYPPAASYEPFTEPPTAGPTDAAVDGCWDCPGTTMTEAEKLAAACSPAMLATFPQHLDLCFPDKWAWVCFTEDPTKNIKEHCAMYRRDLDPYGIFATPAPMPTPEPLPTPVPTEAPDPTLEPEPEDTQPEESVTP